MKFRTLIFSLVGFTFSGLTVNAQNSSTDDSTGLPGDNFSLEGALAMFQKANSPEEFEKMLNTENNHVNNLDLNGDGQTDYVRVIDKSDGKNHAFVLQVPVSDNESQDIAVIELEKSGDKDATLQIVGDEDIYGEQTIAEPGVGTGDDMDDQRNGNGPSYDPDNDYSQGTNGLVVNVWFWPCVRFVYAPAYTLWVSPWRWRHYPMWWHPWRSVGWHVFHPFVRPFHRNFVIVSTHRMVHARAIYTPYRTTSVIVRTHNERAINHYRVTRTTTILRGTGGKVRGTKTVVRGRGRRKG